MREPPGSDRPSETKGDSSIEKLPRKRRYAIPATLSRSAPSQNAGPLLECRWPDLIINVIVLNEQHSKLINRLAFAARRTTRTVELLGRQVTVDDRLNGNVGHLHSIL